jgi:hypothetical protein
MATDLTTASVEQYADIRHPVNGEPRDAAVLATIAAQPMVNALRWLRTRIEEVIGQAVPIGGLLPLAIEAVNTGTNTITQTGNGLSNGDILRFFPVGAGVLPTGILPGRTYRVVAVAANTYQVSATSGGAAIALGTTGSPPFYAMKMVPSVMPSTPLFSGNSTTPPNGSTLYLPENLFSSMQVLEPAADAIIILPIASGPMPGRIVRFYTTAQYAAHKVQLESEGGSVEATFPITAGKSWVDMAFVPIFNGWIPTGWGGGTTIP